MDLLIRPRQKLTGPISVSLNSKQEDGVQNSCSPTTWTTISNLSYLQSYFIEQTDGQSISGWRKMINEGKLLPQTSFKHFLWDYRSEPSAREFCRTVSGVTKRSRYDSNWRPAWTHNVQTADSLLAMVSLPDLNYYVQAAAAKIQSNGFDALTFIAELASLRSMFMNTLVVLTKRLSKIGERFDVFDTWLEGRFGWRTFIYDLQDLQKAIRQFNELKVRSRYAQKVGNSFSTQKVFTATGTSSGITHQYTETFQLDISVRGSVIAEIEIPNFQFNLAVTAWEIVPFSFVIDWLWNVGQSLQALSFLLHVKQYSASSGFRIGAYATGDFRTLSKDSTVVTIYNNYGTYSATGYLEVRSPSTVRFNPMIKFNINGFKWLDAFALIMQQLKRGVKHT